MIFVAFVVGSMWILCFLFAWYFIFVYMVRVADCFLNFVRFVGWVLLLFMVVLGLYSFFGLFVVVFVVDFIVCFLV